MSGRDGTASDLQRELGALLGRVRRRWFVFTILASGGRAAAASSMPLAAFAMLAWLLRPSGSTLVLVAAVGLLAAMGAVVLVLLRMQRRPDDCQVARFVEERAVASDGGSGLSEALVSAVQVAASPQKHPPAFARLIVSNAVDVLRGIDPAAVIPRAAVRRAGLQALAGTVMLGVALLLSLPHLTRAGAVAWVMLFPGSIQIRVLTGDARVRAGQPLSIEAAIRGRGAELAGVNPSLVVSANGQQRSVEMQRGQGGFVYTFESIDRSFTYRVAAGAASSEPYDVTALFPPRVTRIDVRYDYPPFTGQPPRDEEDGGDIYAPAGTRVRLRIHADKAVTTGELSLAEGQPIALRTAPDGTAAADLVLTKDDAYRVKVTDADGLRSSGELEYFIRVMDDRPPDVRIVRPGADQGITPLEEVAIEARAEDDFGIATFDLVLAVAGRAPRTVRFARVSGTDAARLGTHLLAAEELNVQPGDVITYYARARDVARGKRSTETRSDMFFLEVKPFNEEFVAAQSQAMGGGAEGTQIDSLIAAQKEIISATWNLERRSAAGRSVEDMRAVGQAQAELKARAEQMVRGPRRGSPGLYPPQQVGRSRRGGTREDGDAVSAAIEAMGRAVEQLDRARTADALPHEMQALQRLLQAQAEVRRRQVMQQAASSAGQGGTSRTDRDLSALFDRELQRQQRTNYETPKSSQSTEREEAGDALDRIRDLARRQEQLAERQRDLAAKDTAEEERRRELEQLTREQQELRREAEELEKQLQRSGGGSPSQQQASRQGSRSTEIRRAAEQMRNAAQEMQRQNPQAAAASGQRAADALRQGERQMRGGSADARQRAAGELQLEAQQMADTQRRIAAEASRLEQDGERAAADTIRRLAAEKEKLADRIEQFQRSASDLERQMQGAPGARLREAVEQMKRQRIGERIRSSAQDLRDRARGTARQQESPSQVQVEQEISRALESVVDRLGGSPDTRRLTSDLDRTREMRDRLDRLEQRVREAEKNVHEPAAEPGRNAPQDRLQGAREAYARELERVRETLSRMQREQQNGSRGSTPEHHEFSRSAPGTEAFKQDFSGWERLRKDIDVRLERQESQLAARLARQVAEDRLSAGGSDRVPDGYRESVSRYFESLAKERR